MLKLAFRNVLRHKARTGMTLLAIIAGVIGLILSGGFVQDIYRQLGETLIHSQSGHLQVTLPGYFERGARSPEKFVIRDADRIKAEIAREPGVTDVMGRLYFVGLINNGRTDLPIVGEGIEPAREARLGSRITIAAGRKLEERDSNGMLLGQDLARALQLKPGDWVNLVVTTPEGAINTLEFQVVGTFQTFSKDYDARALRIPLAAAQDLMATPGINTLVVALNETDRTQAVAASLEQRLRPTGMTLHTWPQLNDFYAKTVEMYDSQFGVLRLIILLMVLLSVANSVNMSVFERVGEFGTMMALGNRSSRVFRLIVLENTIIGMVGASVGILAGAGLALVISAIGIPMPPPPNADISYVAHIRIVASILVSSWAVGLVATVLAAVVPAQRVRHIPVVDALRENI